MPPPAGAYATARGRERSERLGCRGADSIDSVSRRNFAADLDPVAAHLGGRRRWADDRISRWTVPPFPPPAELFRRAVRVRIRTGRESLFASGESGAGRPSPDRLRFGSARSANEARFLTIC